MDPMNSLLIPYCAMANYIYRYVSLHINEVFELRIWEASPSPTTLNIIIYSYFIYFTKPSLSLIFMVSIALRPYIYKAFALWFVENLKKIKHIAEFWLWMLSISHFLSIFILNLRPLESSGNWVSETQNRIILSHIING